jgi:hypothetical protein
VEATSKNFDAGIVNESTEEEDRQKHNYKKGFDSNPAHFTLRLLEGLVVVLQALSNSRFVSISSFQINEDRFMALIKLRHFARKAEVIDYSK